MAKKFGTKVDLRTKPRPVKAGKWGFGHKPILPKASRK